MKDSEKLSIKNNILKIEITKIGAELCSITNQNGQEFIWQADPDVWGSHAPVLFPIIGALKKNKFYYQGKKYSVPKHGFIRHNKNLIVTDHKESSITFQYKYDKKTLKDYPFEFEFNLTFSLDNNSLNVNHEIINHGANPMFFSLGGHPAFKCPLQENENYNDYFLKFEKKEDSIRHLINNQGLQNGKTQDFFNNTDMLPLKHDLFKDDALIFKDLKSKEISLNHITKGKILTISYKDFDYVGVWAKTNGDFVCIEPWLGITDHEDTDGNFETKEGILKLDAKRSFNARYSISIDF
ncbi:aldose 1-epimerase family protein [Galbibacter sp. EGI 63066]|uniref:aldose 1-epimerase family protein n=1 Tax=Galbibacter sp. EGI 63066 TaxID=2993559 RepID=UPI002249738A|nr:aldose 1-epimerase family protein [Galbibacter sp. EGI 63066]MCX2678716.1 aldose 1-epimerase family protein [Galbibacter sp. EGI 63066]